MMSGEEGNYSAKEEDGAGDNEKENYSAKEEDGAGDNEEENYSAKEEDGGGDGDGDSTPIHGGVATKVEVDSQFNEFDSEYRFLNGGKIEIHEKVTEVVEVFQRVCYFQWKKYKKEMKDKLEKSSKENEEKVKKLQQTMERLVEEKQQLSKKNVSQREEIEKLAKKNSELKRTLKEKENQLTKFKSDVVKRFHKFMEVEDHLDPIGLGPNQTQSRSGGSSSIQNQAKKEVRAVHGKKQPKDEGSSRKPKSGTPVVMAQRGQRSSPSPCSSQSDPVPEKRRKVRRSRSRSPRRLSSELKRIRDHRSASSDKSIRSDCSHQERDHYRKEQASFFGTPDRDRRKFKCSICKYCFFEVCDLKKHFKDKHGKELPLDQIAGCKSCGNIFSNKEFLKLHWEISGCSPVASLISPS